MQRKMTKNHFQNKGKHRFLLTSALIFAIAMSGCSQTDPSSADANLKQDLPADANKEDNPVNPDNSSENPGTSAKTEKTEPGTNNPSENIPTGKATMKDGNLAALLGTSADDIEQALGKYNGDLNASKTFGSLMYPGLSIQCWNSTGEIYSISLLDSENPDWNIFGIRPGDSMEEARNQITSQGGKKQQNYSMYDSAEKYQIIYQEQQMQVGISNGGVGEQVDTLQVYFDANNMAEDLGIQLPDALGMEDFGMSSDDEHITELQEKYPDALVSMDGFTNKIEYQGEWLDASIYYVTDLANGEDYMFAYTPEGQKFCAGEQGTWTPEK